MATQNGRAKYRATWGHCLMYFAKASDASGHEAVDEWFSTPNDQNSEQFPAASIVFKLVGVAELGTGRCLPRVGGAEVAGRRGE